MNIPSLRVDSHAAHESHETQIAFALHEFTIRTNRRFARIENSDDSHESHESHDSHARARCANRTISPISHEIARIPARARGNFREKARFFAICVFSSKNANRTNVPPGEVFIRKPGRGDFSCTEGRPRTRFRTFRTNRAPGPGRVLEHRNRRDFAH